MSGAIGGGEGAEDRATPVETTDESFSREVEDFPGWCVVEFSTAWCIPCRMFSEVVRRAVEPLLSSGKCKFVRHDVDRGPAVAERYVVYAVPALYVYSHGTVRGKLLGYHPEDEVRTFLTRIVGHP
ncbi:thioredoxin family protein [Brockia lithotrophica]|uniref:Thioredoxin n=1 Tax=Brockia lithotrophica TaxID=933949 RepID=A0A660KU68_9BACL|nr:thioredoxin family protein [Brockia lithotrophica]RKQ84594.1 thioredoxin [Brockia lithotrophica]